MAPHIGSTGGGHSHAKNAKKRTQPRELIAISVGINLQIRVNFLQVRVNFLQIRVNFLQIRVNFLQAFSAN